jgi:uracil-DNA glycosylase family 4
MSRESILQALAISHSLQEQLKFYREIGVEDIGGSSSNLQSVYAAATTLAPSTTQEHPTILSQHSDPRLQPGTSVEQGALFGEIANPVKPTTKEARRAIGDWGDASLVAIREDLGDCQRCKLHEHRRTIVFGEGNPGAKLVFVGEGPGAEEDATGRPFVGRAGQLLDKIIAAIGLKREDVYIANIVKCRPPGNRTPERDEVETCEPFLFRQIACIKPLVIVALGSPAFQCLLRTREPITRARGQWRDLNGIRVMPTFHPAFLLRSPDKKREVWEDMKKVRDYLNSK